MAKPEWGMKRICPQCGARYYDLNRDPVVCPKCGSHYDPETVMKSRRGKAPPPEVPIGPIAEEEIETEIAEEAEAEVEGEEVAVEAGEEAEAEGEEEEEEEVPEDASELGEDEDDMAEVIENVEDEEER